MRDYQRESQTLKLLAYLRDHPGMVLSIAYTLLTLCGVIYSASFYKQFDIAILKLANVSDLLIAGLSEPAALLMFFGGLLMAIFSDLLTQRLDKVQAKWREKPKGFKRTFMLTVAYTPKKSEHVMLMVIGIFILYATMFVTLFAEWHSERIKEGAGDKVLVSSDVLDGAAKEFTLLGSTTNFVLTYDPDADQVTVIPIENLDRLSTVVDAPQE